MIQLVDEDYLSLIKEKILPRIEDNYNIFKVKVGRGSKLRTIEEPNKHLKMFQKRLVDYFEQFPLLSCCVAKKGGGIAVNATAHMKANHILKIDLKDCYHNVKYTHIEHALYTYVPIGIDHNRLLQFVDYCIYQDRLPTGAPTSPILCNIALTPIDEDLLELAKKYGYTYTRYIDDLHFSTTSQVRVSELREQIEFIIQYHGFKPNHEKTRWMTIGKRDQVKVTGVVIGAQAKVPTQFKRMIRAKLQNLAKQKKEIDAEAQGCLAYIKSIDPEKYESLLQYYKRRLDYVPAE